MDDNNLNHTRSHIRQSNWELMRIVAMCMIIAGHFITQSEYMSYIPTKEGAWFGVFFGRCSRIAVNMFLLLGCWFMVEAKFSARRIIKLYFNVWTLTAPITIMIYLLGFPVSGKDIVRGIFPLLGVCVWFASSYIALILIAPWLNKFMLLPQHSFKKLLLLLTGLISIWMTIHSMGTLHDGWLDSFVWFNYIFLLVGYYKKYCSFKFNKWLVLVVGIASYCTLVMIEYGAVNINGMAHIAKILLDDFKTIPKLFIAACFFYFFHKLDIGKMTWINFLATGAFSTYIIHQTPAFIHVLWFDVYNCREAIVRYNPLIYSIFVVVTVYIFCLFVEYIRRKFIEPVILNCYLAKRLELFIDKFYINV